MSGIDPTVPDLGVAAAHFDVEVSLEDVLRFEAGEPPQLGATQTFRRVSGRYRGTSEQWQIELRVDVDGRRPLRRLSGDYFFESGGKLSYHSSFTVDAPKLRIEQDKAIVEGTGRFAFQVDAPIIRVTIPRVPEGDPPPAATLQFLKENGVLGSTFACDFECPYFRTVEIEEDVEQGVTPFHSYDTGLLQRGGTARNLTMLQSYAEAGIHVRSSSTPEVLSQPVGGTWSNAELDAAMRDHFNGFNNEPQWKIWLFHGRRHEAGNGTFGMMFDDIDSHQRQGCTVFHDAIGGAAAIRDRLGLHTCVHELGHCFNLVHSFAKSRARPPMPDRANALSWMNYPWNYPDGESAFWAAFPFQFDDFEIRHLRHASRDEIVMGGSAFESGAALALPELCGDPGENGGLDLVLEAPPVLDYGEPVWVELKLYNRERQARRVHCHLHPREGQAWIGIWKPGGHSVFFDPLFHQCVAPATAVLDENQPSIYESVYLGFGKRGLSFDQPGLYQIRAFYRALEGTWIVSNILTLRVRSPLNTVQDELAGLFLGREQGLLLCLRGSDAAYLDNGNNAFQQVIEKYGNHPFASYARLVKGVNLAREFKSVKPGGKVAVRPSRLEEAKELLDPVIEACARRQAGINNITVNRAMRRLAQGQMEAGDRPGAQSTMDRMVELFERKALKTHVLELVQRQAADMMKEPRDQDRE